MTDNRTSAIRLSGGPARYLPGYLLLVGLPVLGALAVTAYVAGESGAGASGGPDVPGGTALVNGYRLLLATVVILGVIRLLGAVVRLLGQPAVVGEIVAGITLGPSVLGALAPDAQAWLFPTTLLPSLETLAQLGVIFFMFLVGHELPLGLLRRSGAMAAALAQTSTAVPFLCGVLLAVSLPDRYTPDGGGPRLALVLFMGVAFAITAFPVLARILGEQRLIGTPLGTLGMATAGIGDVIAWCLLAAVTAVAGNDSVVPAVIACSLVIVYGLAMFAGVRPALSRLVPRMERAGQAAMAACVLCVVLASAWLTDSIGAHAIFGAFVAGLVMPRNSVAIRQVVDKIEGLTMWLMLPIFFAVVGLKLDLGSIGGPADWAVLGLIIVVASIGKLGGVTLFARLLGLNWRSATGLGLMMNCRGVTELVVLQIGLTLGVLTPRLFAMLTCMALITTAATGPLLHRLRLPRTAAGPGGSGPGGSGPGGSGPGETGTGETGRGETGHPTDADPDAAQPLLTTTTGSNR